MIIVDVVKQDGLDTTSACLNGCREVHEWWQVVPDM